MKTLIQMFSIFALGVAVGSLAIPASSAPSAPVRKTTVTRLMTTDLAGWCDGKEMIIEINASTSGTSGPHYHPGHSFNYVIGGTQLVTAEGSPPRTYRAGEVFPEAPMTSSTSESPSPTRMVTVRILEKGKPETVYVQ